MKGYLRELFLYYYYYPILVLDIYLFIPSYLPLSYRHPFSCHHRLY